MLKLVLDERNLKIICFWGHPSNNENLKGTATAPGDHTLELFIAHHGATGIILQRKEKTIRALHVQKGNDTYSHYSKCCPSQTQGTKYQQMDRILAERQWTRCGMILAASMNCSPPSMSRMLCSPKRTSSWLSLRIQRFLRDTLWVSFLSSTLNHQDE
ncbi:uncharacterized protein RHO17_008714 [Thomomys bottae]